VGEEVMRRGQKGKKRWDSCAELFSKSWICPPMNGADIQLP